MFFGPLSLPDAEGAILAHSLRLGSVSFKKGRRLSASDVAALREAGLAEVIAAKLNAADIGEDTAASRIATAVAGEAVQVAAAFTGRVNLFAGARGLLRLDPARIDAINAIDESVTIATLPDFAPVEPGQMLATVKIIPFAAPAAAVEQAESLAADGGQPLAVLPYRPLSVALIQTRLPGVKDSVLDKTIVVTRERVEAFGGTLVHEARCDHDEGALTDRIAAMPPADLLLIAGASAITDRRDVLPAAIERAGGTVEHFGMPVDPGNLLLLGQLGGKPVLGLPGCARSPKLNGFDWVLQRIAAGKPPGRAEVMRMGVGGLLAEIPTRPSPRAGGEAEPQLRAPRVTALVLAAGRSSRMGSTNKLLAEVNGAPLVARAVDAALASQAATVIVVTGHQGESVARVLADRPVTFVHNPAFGDGLSSSLRAGLAAVPSASDAVVVCLGDMPRVASAVIDRLIAAYAPLEGRAICVPTTHGKQGNPVLWDRAYFAEMAAITGDTGAKRLIGQHADRLCEVPVDDAGILYDVDTPDLLARFTATVSEPDPASAGSWPG
ncbi:4-diphosphocytidyl-2C-methyl-D-erythritol kinase [Azospirillum thiophilum]|uniref:4-diphosphocytidyl-2C-methyl-D-erythritol kinase n=1 Tax=Azospirillum thiophilum TaxID=528244 RepID=A0AAC8W0I7_9PROT|nr:molybdopterin-binding/glycosyltransferase family 2 protein [Azospirillum thiophilum]ALG72736.1 4-diphosphocytidyl-2C-methyl-D-erythritol kinase [Azospirillum thiophilum]KJR64345.1 4-diphosphocytidyl-2C-methyl-D-erythritol kinase [Azospirillum thiophilum]